MNAKTKKMFIIVIALVAIIGIVAGIFICSEAEKAKKAEEERQVILQALDKEREQLSRDSMALAKAKAEEAQRYKLYVLEHNGLTDDNQFGRLPNCNTTFKGPVLILYVGAEKGVYKFGEILTQSGKENKEVYIEDHNTEDLIGLIEQASSMVVVLGNRAVDETGYKTEVQDVLVKMVAITSSIDIPSIFIVTQNMPQGPDEYSYLNAACVSLPKMDFVLLAEYYNMYWITSDNLNAIRDMVGMKELPPVMHVLYDKNSAEMLTRLIK